MKTLFIKAQLKHRATPLKIISAIVLSGLIVFSATRS